MCRHSSPLFASAAIAVAICEGAARKSALATRKRLASSHSSSPPRTEAAPARERRGHPKPKPTCDCAPRSPASPSPPLELVAQLGHARQHEALDVDRAFNVTQAFERVEQRAHLGLRELARGFEEPVLVQEIVGLGDVLLL